MPRLKRIRVGANLLGSSGLRARIAASAQQKSRGRLRKREYIPSNIVFGGITDNLRGRDGYRMQQLFALFRIFRLYISAL